MKEIIIISPVNDGVRSPALFTLHNLLKTKKGKQGGRGGGGSKLGNLEQTYFLNVPQANAAYLPPTVLATQMD